MWAAGGLGLALVGCGGSANEAATTAGAATTGDASTAGPPAVGATTTIPQETAGPFPGDGSNGPNVLADSGVVRRDITRSFGSASGVAEGVPATVTLTLLDISEGGTPLAGGAVYLWHCDRDGRYTLYSDGVTDENYLRGVQESDPEGKLTFATIFPGCYPGRWPHMHFEVYPSLKDAAAGANKLVTSQLAIPRDACEVAYASSGYEESASNLSRLSIETDMVFSDGVSTQLASVAGTPQTGMAITLNVGV